MRSKKCDKKPIAEMSSKTPKLSKQGVGFHAGDAPKISKIHKFAKMDPRDVLGSKKHPKDTQKASKWRPKTVPKTSKLVKIPYHCNTHSKIPLQRTAKNHAP